MARREDGAALLICKCGSTSASVHPLATHESFLQHEAFGLSQPPYNKTTAKPARCRS
jgi:hypothetical protein